MVKNFKQPTGGKGEREPEGLRGGGGSVSGSCQKCLNWKRPQVI